MFTLPHRFPSREAFINSPVSQVPAWFDIETDTVSSCLRRHAQDHPEAILFQNLEREWSFAEVEHRANQIAEAILEILPSDEPCAIAVLAAEMSDQVDAVLGILKSGHYFVILNPDNPYNFSQSICQDSGASLIIGDSNHPSLTGQLSRGANIPFFEIKKVLERRNDAVVNLDFSPDRLACIAYTSGSTGKSKGVIYTHRTLIYLVIEEMEIFPRTPDDRIFGITDLIFLPGVVRLVGQIIQGFPFTFIPPHRISVPHLRDVLRQRKITHYNAMPSTFRALFSEFDEGEKFEYLRVIRAGGEPVYRADVVLFQAHAGTDWLFVHSMGNSEIGYVGYSFIRSLDEVTGSQLTLNTAVHNKQILILDDERKPVPVDVPGELHVRVSSAYQGYWNRPELTAACFFPDPADANFNWYYPSDRAIFLADGSIQPMGRSDQAVKIRGYRIDTTIIEAQLLLHDQVKQAVVLVAEGGTSRPQLIAYVVPKNIATIPSPRSLRDYLAEHLPMYMIPHAFKMLERFPLTHHGKLDRLAIPTSKTIQASFADDVSLVYAQTPTQIVLVQIWEDLLKVEKVSIHARFVDLGGDSLLAMKMILRASTVLQQEIPVIYLNQAETIGELAALIDEPKGPAKSYGVLKENGTQANLFFPFSADGPLLVNQPLITHLKAPWRFIGLQPPLPLMDAFPHNTVPEKARYCIEIMRSVQPTGPYHLAGFSFSGILAYEIAQQLQQQGEEVGLLFILDSVLWQQPRFISGAVAYRLKNHLIHLSQLKLWQWGAYYAKIKKRRSDYQRSRKEVPEELLQAYKMNTDAVRRYQPQPYRGDVVVLLATETEAHEKNRKRRWHQLVKGNIHYISVTGNHEMVMQEPNVSQWAHHIDELLKEISPHP